MISPARLAEIEALLDAHHTEAEVTLVAHPGFHEKHERKVNLLQVCRELLNEIRRERTGPSPDGTQFLLPAGFITALVATKPAPKGKPKRKQKSKR